MNTQKPEILAWTDALFFRYFFSFFFKHLGHKVPSLSEIQFRWLCGARLGWSSHEFNLILRDNSIYLTSFEPASQKQFSSHLENAIFYR